MNDVEDRAGQGEALDLRPSPDYPVNLGSACAKSAFSSSVPSRRKQTREKGTGATTSQPTAGAGAAALLLGTASGPSPLAVIEVTGGAVENGTGRVRIPHLAGTSPFSPSVAERSHTVGFNVRRADPDARVRSVNKLDQFFPHTLGRNDLDAVGHLGHGEPDVVVNAAELR